MKDASKGANPGTTEIELLTPKEAAVLLRLSESFLAKARMRGDGPRYRKLSRAVRYTRADLVLWLKASAKTSTSEWDGGNRRDQAAPHEGQNSSTSRKEEE
jgi:hypothetical protein